MPKNTTKNDFANTVTSSYIQSFKGSIKVKPKVDNQPGQTLLTKLKPTKVNLSSKLETFKDISDLKPTELPIAQSRL